jgi:acetyl-CoA C-acetyltransferase
MGIGPVPATAKALDRAGLRLADMDLVELNEAFAAQVLAVLREWHFGQQYLERLNVNGSGSPLATRSARRAAYSCHSAARDGPP